jgi:ABC-type transporter Mla subunit MlaD
VGFGSEVAVLTVQSEIIQLKRKPPDWTSRSFLNLIKSNKSIPMTSSNANNSACEASRRHRLDRVENILDNFATGLDRLGTRLDRLAIGLEETKAIANSNSRAIQAIMEQQATEMLKREEEKAQHEQRMARLEDLMTALASIEQGQNRMLANIDEAQPTMLKRLMAIENKVDTLIERNQ